MEFLKKHGISDEVIEQIIDDNYEEVISNFICNEKEVSLIIEYLKDFGMENIEDLLLSHIDIFFKTKEKIEQGFKRYRKEDVLKLVNEDSINIDMFLK